MQEPQDIFTYLEVRATVQKIGCLSCIVMQLTIPHSTLWEVVLG